MLTKKSNWHIRALFISLLATLLIYLAFSFWDEREQFIEAALKVGALGILTLLFMSLVNYGLRFIRWQAYLKRLGHHVPWQANLRIYLSGFALTTTPGKAGEMFRSVPLKQHGVPVNVSLAAFFSERISDLLAIVLLAIIGLAQHPNLRFFVMIGGGTVILLLLLLSSLKNSRILNFNRGYSTGRAALFFSHFISMLLEARSCHRLDMLLMTTTLSILAWGAEGLAFYWVILWLDWDVTLSFAIFVYAISLLSGAISFMPGGLGGAEAAMVSLLLLSGMPSSNAIAATIIIRLATLWFAIAIGLLALYAGRKGEEASL